MKNLFAVIGLCVVIKKSYELYREYSELKRERNARQSSPSLIEGRTSSSAHHCRKAYALCRLQLMAKRYFNQ